MAQSALPWSRRTQSSSATPALRLRDPWWLLSLPLLLFLALPLVAMFLRTPPDQLWAKQRPRLKFTNFVGSTPHQ